MPPLDFQDSEWASKETGTMTVRFNVISKGRNKRLIDYFSHRNDNMQEQVQQRAVLTPDEIGRPADNRVTFFMPNTQPFQGHLIPYYKVSEINKRFVEGAKDNFAPREAPLHYEETMPQPVYKSGEGQQASSGGVGSIFNLTPDQVREALANVKPVIGYDEAEPVAKEWWNNFELANSSNMAAVLSFAHELRKRFVKINEFYTIYATTGLTDVPQILAAIDTHIYGEYKKMLGWETGIRSDAKTWWIAFEEANQSNFPVVVELARELIKRGVSIENFFDAYVASNANNIPAILSYLDDMVRDGRVQAASASIFAKTQASGQASATTGQNGGTVRDSFVSSTNPEGDGSSSQVNFSEFDEMLEKAGSNYSLVFNSATSAPKNEDTQATPYDVQDDVQNSVQNGAQDSVQERDEPFHAPQSALNNVNTVVNNGTQKHGWIVEAATGFVNESRDVLHSPNSVFTDNTEEVDPVTEQINNYFLMARELLAAGNSREFDLLIDLVKDDPVFSDEHFDQLLEMRRKLPS